MSADSAEHDRPVYEWDVAAVGDDVPPHDVTVTPELIDLYVKGSGDENPIYMDEEFARSKGLSGRAAPASMAIRAAPTRRAVIMGRKGYAHPVRPTPFARWECQMFAPIQPGDVITSTSRLADKFEKRGRKFVVWEITAHNQRGEKVLVHRCTNMWEGAKPEDRER